MVDLSSEVLYILLTVNYNSVKEGGFGEEGGVVQFMRLDCHCSLLKSKLNATGRAFSQLLILQGEIHILH